MGRIDARQRLRFFPPCTAALAFRVASEILTSGRLLAKGFIISRYMECSAAFCLRQTNLDDNLAQYFPLIILFIKMIHQDEDSLWLSFDTALTPGRIEDVLE